jgi:hypothetical protein
MSTNVSATVQFDHETGLEVTAYAGVQGAADSHLGPFIGIRSSDVGSAVTLILRDHVAIERLRSALEEAESKLTAIEAVQTINAPAEAAS